MNWVSWIGYICSIKNVNKGLLQFVIFTLLILVRASPTKLIPWPWLWSVSSPVERGKAVWAPVCPWPAPGTCGRPTPRAGRPTATLSPGCTPSRLKNSLPACLPACLPSACWPASSRTVRPPPGPAPLLTGESWQRKQCGRMIRERGKVSTTGILALENTSGRPLQVNPKFAQKYR